MPVEDSGTANELDFSQCEREVLDRTGRLQAQGALLLLDFPSRWPQACSENWNSLTGAAIVRFDAPYALDGILAPGQDPDGWTEQPRRLRLAEGIAHEGVEVLGSRRQQTLQLEWLPLQSERFEAWELKLEAGLNLYEAAHLTATSLRAGLGLDRVMIYKFDQEHAGDVIAEARRSDWEPFLGLHYPATDIPQIARSLYLKIRLRSIHDAYSQAIPLLTRPGLSAERIDLTPVSLRSVSPYHLEYLRNMGVRATVSAAIVVAGQLWGLIACHHGQPLLLPLAAREALLNAADTLAQAVSSAEQRRQASHEAALSQTLSELESLLAQARTSDAQILEHLLLGPYGLTALTRSQAAAIYAGDTLIETGSTPGLDWVRRFVESFLTLQPDGRFSTDRLASESPLPLPPDAPWSGLLALVIHQDPRVVLLVFRQPYLKEIHWGGDPGRAALQNEQGRLSPRRSFSLWKETVMDRSKPWLPLEVDYLLGLRDLLSRHFAPAEFCGRVRRGSQALSEQMLEHAYIARAVTSGQQQGLVMTTVEQDAGPATLLQLNQNLQELFELSPDTWRTGEDVGQFMARLGLVQSPEQPEHLGIWSPVQGHRYLKIHRQVLLGVEQPGRRHAVVSLQFVDLTGEERMSDALKSAIERAEAANEAKSRFLANTSHELKTPLHAILGFQGLLNEDLGTAEIDELRLYCEQIGLASRHMLNLVDQLLFFSKSRRGALQLPITRLALDQLLRETAGWHAYSAQARQLEIVLELPEQGLELEANDQTLRQLLSNLINNAIRFSHPGGRIVCSLRHDAFAAQAEIAIADFGLGMSDHERAHAFEAFFQGQQPPAQAEGSGIGLSLVKAICEAHGGRAEIESRQGQGTTVRVRLPLRQAERLIDLKPEKAGNGS